MWKLTDRKSSKCLIAVIVSELNAIALQSVQLPALFTVVLTGSFILNMHFQHAEYLCASALLN